MNNKKLGNRIEKLVLSSLQGWGFWAHLLVDNMNGQPFDIIALKGNMSFCIDAKNLEENVHSFSFRRIEENQWNAMELVSRVSTSSVCGFAVYHCGIIYFAPYDIICKMMENGKTSIPITYLQTLKRYIEVLYASNSKQ